MQREKSLAVNEALRTATELPLSIAKLCCDLAKFAGEVFDYGFKSARGDSSVALQCAISAATGCLSIIELNLSVLPVDSWMEKIRAEKMGLKNQFIEITALGNSKLVKLESLTEEKWKSQQPFIIYKNGKLGKTIRNEQDMEKLVRDFQNALWLNQENIWGEGVIENVLQLISPKDIFEKVLGYTFERKDYLGMHVVEDEVFEVAGLINKKEMHVSISKNFSEDVMNFTAAHELGHALLHEETVLHRDRAFDGSSNTPKDFVEQQADKFAALLLMPAKIVKQVFQELFETDKLILNESTALGFSKRNFRELRGQYRDQKGFAMMVAQTEVYKGKQFNSLAKIFKVSHGAMAIRLIELTLIEF